MANRSYLYAIDAVPAIDSSPSESRCIGISEFNGAIPIVFKLLLTGNPRACRSIIWKTPDEIALVGEYALGFQRLKEFLARIDLPAAQPLIQECLDFLEDNKHRRNYFLLECGEIFELTEEPLDQQNAKLLNEITDLDAEIDQALERVKATIVNGPRSEGLPPNLSAAAKELDAEVEGLFGGLLPIRSIKSTVSGLGIGPHRSTTASQAKDDASDSGKLWLLSLSLRSSTSPPPALVGFPVHAAILPQAVPSGGVGGRVGRRRACEARQRACRMGLTRFSVVLTGCPGMRPS
jgi:hypothetical protein